MRSSNSQPARSRSATQPDVATGNETARIIGNARVKHNACLMAHNQYGMGEFGRLFYLISDLDKRRLEGVLDSTDEVRESHRLCLRCSLKFVAFCRFFCGIQLPRRLASYEDEYDRLLALFGPGRDFMSEVRDAIDKAKPVATPKPPPNSRLRGRSLAIFPTDIRAFRGDFDR